MKQRSPDFDIKTTWLAISKMYNVRAVREDITANIGFVLIHIDEEAGTPATKIAPLMGMEPRSLTRMLASLEEKNFIYRQADEKDGRVVRIFLTELGLEKRKVAKEVVLNFNKAIYAKFSESKLRIFFEVMDGINELVKEMHQRHLLEIDEETLAKIEQIGSDA